MIKEDKDTIRVTS